MLNRSLTPPRLAIALISAAALAYEILLMRLFSIIQWHHFAYMIISLALLGYGISGSVVTIFQEKLLRNFPSVFLVNAAMFGVSSIVCYLLAQSMPFNAEEILWNADQSLTLLSIYLLLAVPFFFAANCIALAISYFRDQISNVYAMDLLGAGAGSLAIMVLLKFYFPEKTLLILVAVVFVSVAVAWLEMRLNKRWWNAGFIVAATIMIIVPADIVKLNISPYKPLPQTLRIPGAAIVSEQSSPMGLITTVKSPTVPIRHAPGLSLLADEGPSEQLAVFTDGDAMTAITRFPDNIKSLSYVDQSTSAVAYHIRPPLRVLILGAGGGSDVLQARYFDAPHIDAVEINPQMVALLNTEFSQFSGHLYQMPGITLHVEDARGFLADNDHQYDLIQVTMFDSFGASSAGLYALNESYLYTVEALSLYIQSLSAQGVLSVTRWVKMPPRDALKLFATAIEALENSGISKPAKHLVLIRSWQTSTLLVKKSAFLQAEIEKITGFCESRGFDIAYYPGIGRESANRYNILKEPYYLDAATQLLDENRQSFQDSYKFNIHPSTDDKPYFFHFFKWSSLKELLQLRGQGGLAMLEWGYLVLVATLFQAVVASIVLILAPLLIIGKKNGFSQVKPHTLNVFMYFSAIGLGFLFIEIAFIQKFILFLHHPLYSVAVILTSFLIFAGLGSAVSQRLITQGRNKHWLSRVVWAIALSVVVYAFILDPVFNLVIGTADAVKYISAILLLSPLAFVMGMPFPLAMSELQKNCAQLIPWAWGVNGCASVISTVLATLLAVQFGFTIVLMVAVLLYFIALMFFPGNTAP